MCQWRNACYPPSVSQITSTLRDILVHVDASQAGRARVVLAAEVVNRMVARLTVLHCMPPADVPHQCRPGDVQAAWMSMTVRLAREAKECARRFSDETRRAGVTSMWFNAEGDVVPGICRRAHYADLI